MSICLRVYGYLKRVVFAGDFMPIQWYKENYYFVSRLVRFRANSHNKNKVAFCFVYRLEFVDNPVIYVQYPDKTAGLIDIYCFLQKVIMSQLTFPSTHVFTGE